VVTVASFSDSAPQSPDDDEGPMRPVELVWRYHLLLDSEGLALSGRFDPATDSLPRYIAAPGERQTPELTFLRELVVRSVPVERVLAFESDVQQLLRSAHVDASARERLVAAHKGVAAAYAHGSVAEDVFARLGLTRDDLT
jgi:hypothetical protein